MNPQPSGLLSHSPIAYFWDVNLYKVLLRCSGIKGYYFVLAYCNRKSSNSRHMHKDQKKSFDETGIWAFLPRQEAMAGPGKLLLGESYQNNFVLSYGTKIEKLDSRCFWLVWRLLCWRSQGRLAKRSFFQQFYKDDVDVDPFSRNRHCTRSRKRL